MNKRYRVELEAIQYEEVEADSPAEAEDIAIENVYGYRPTWTPIDVREIEQ